MKKYLITLLITLLYLLPSLTFAQQATVLADTLKIYERPTTDAPVLCTRGKGATVTIISTDSVTHFCYVKACLDGRTGYVPAYHLKPLGAAPAPVSGEVYVCNSKGAKSYHSRRSCRGLGNCKASVSAIPLGDAQAYRSACAICH